MLTSHAGESANQYVSYKFYLTTNLSREKKKWLIEFTQPGLNHDFHPLRLLENVISPDAEVFVLYKNIKKIPNGGSKW